MDPLFQPIRINTLEIKNRIHMPAMQLHLCENYAVTDAIVDFYAERAKGGAGLITVGVMTVDALSAPPTAIGGHNDGFISGLGRLAGAINDHGSRSMVQINHMGRYARSDQIGAQPVAPSPIASRLTREVPRELLLVEIDQLMTDYEQTARRAKAAGFDGVEVLAGTGYLISQFLSPVTNQRTDAYGGSFENRMRFGLDVLKAVRGAVGSDYPVVFRINGNDFMPNGNGREELQLFARVLADAGVDALNINVGWHEARMPQITAAVPRGVFGYLARGIRDLVEVPVMAGHRIHNPATARKLLADGMCDMVCMARPLIADPYLPKKARDGRELEIVHCVACAQGCFDHVIKGEKVECLCNPKAGHEKDCRMTKANIPRRVMVVGGGPAGMSAALAAAECGHRVTLYEKNNELGGQLHLAGSPPGREEFKALAVDFARQVAIADIKVKYGQTVDEAIIEAESPESVVLATGASPLTPPIPGVDLPHVVQAWDVLSDRVVTGGRVLIIGGGAVGVETALFLAEKGTLSGDAVKFLLVNQAEEPEFLREMAIKGTKEVTLVEMIDAIGVDIGITTRWSLLQDMDRSGVNVHKRTRALEVTPKGVTVERNGEVSEIFCDTVVLAAGSKSYNPLQKVLMQKKIPYQVVGDARKIGLAFDAVHQGFAAGKGI